MFNFIKGGDVMKNKIRFVLTIVCLFGASIPAHAQLPKLPKSPLSAPSNPVSAVAPGANPSPELVGQLSKDLNVTEKQATGGAGALFGLAKSRLKPEEFGKVSDAVPGMDGLLAAAPKSPLSGGSPLGSAASALPGKVGGLAPVATAFKSLGLSPEMAAKFVPVLTNFVGSKGGAAAASLLAGVLK